MFQRLQHVTYYCLHVTSLNQLALPDNKQIYIYIYVLTTKSLIIITLHVQFPIFQGYYAIYHVHQKRDTPGIKRKLEQKHLNPPTIHHHPSPSITIPQKSRRPGPFRPPWRGPGSRQSACAPKTWPWPTSSCGIFEDERRCSIATFHQRVSAWWF